MKKTVLYLLLLLLATLPLEAQILNTDKLGRPVDSTHFIAGAFDIGATVNKQNSLLVAVDTKADLSYWHLNNVLIFAGSFALFRTGSENLVNGGYSHLRFRMRLHKTLQPEVFAQYQLDNIRGMKKRILGGGNLRFRIIDKKDAALFIAIGAMYEYEHWDYSGIRPNVVVTDKTPIDNHFIKMNSYISYRQKVNDWATFNATLYFQSRPDSYFVVPRVSSDAQLSFKLTKHIGFAIAYNVFWDAAPPVPIFNWYYTIVNKLTFTF